MREILFKAKRTDSGEWVEGYYCRRKHYCFDNRTDDLQTIIITEFSPNGYVFFEVDESTLCQYTGLTDKNGNKIWENDVVSMHQFLFDGNEYEKEMLVSIEYTEEMMCFSANLIKAKEIKAYMGYATDDVEKCVVPFNEFYGLHEESFDVIGNIFDNPELVKAGGVNE